MYVFMSSLISIPKKKKFLSLAKPTDQQDILYSSNLIKICNQCVRIICLKERKLGLRLNDSCRNLMICSVLYEVIS